MARWDHKRGSSPRGAPRDARVAGTPLRGPHKSLPVVMGPGSRHSASKTRVDALKGSAGATMAWAERRTNLRLWEMAADAIPLFRIVINNGEFNSSV